ncbi:phage tail protein [Bacillus wiedmannii]|uniref:phage tail protein n=1 Tax=Bacillus wiedmannii TaxID=1890302 RepID=UPI000BF030F6|nr:phage tail protein [Bacillus wiedmannii]PEJ49481.1 peptidase S74 [Bacillus wiedmannii]
MIKQKYVEEYIELYRSGKVKFNKERELLIKYLEKYVLNRDDLYFDDEMIEDCINFGEKWYFPLQPFQKFLIAFVFLFYKKNGRVFYRKFLWMLGRGGGSQFQYYYESPLKYQMPELIRHRQVENIEDDKIKDKETALKRCKEAVEDIPIVSITVDHKEASFDDTNEPKVGDKAILQHHKYNMDFDVRVVKRRRYPFEQTPNVYEFSNKRDELVDRTEEQKKWTSDILSVVKELDNKLLEQSNDYSERLNKITEEKVEEVRQESEAAKELAELVKENQKNFQTTIVENNVPPTDYLEAGKSLWLDTSKGKPGILKKWNGKTWDPIIADVEAIKNETLQQVNKDIESTKTELNQKVQEAQNQATGQYNEVTQNLQGVTRTIANVQNEQGNISKTVSQMQQTNEGFKTSIESLTKKDGEISSKLNTVESNVEGTKKTISEVQQTTSELKKTTTEVKEQAGKISEKLTSVETKVNNDKAGGRNLLLDSNVKYEKTDYLINQFTLSENFSVGEEYTFVIKGSAPQGQKFGIWQNGGSTNVGYAESVYANGVTYVTFKAVAATSGNERKLSLYNFPSNTTKAVVEWVALYKGNKPQDWTPAPENQVTNAEFTKKATEIEKSVEGVKTTVTGVQNSQSGFEKRMTTVEQTANGLSNSVSQLAQTTANQGKQITDANSKLNQQAKLIEAKVTINQVQDYVGGFQIPALKNTVDKNREEYLQQIVDKVAKADYNKKTTEIDNRLKINEEGIGLSAKKTEVYTRVEADGKYATTAYVKTMESRIDIAERNINLSVKEGNVIAAINISKETIQLDAKRINLKGAVTAESIASKLLEGITIRAIDPNDKNKKAEMTAGGNIFSEWKTTPSSMNGQTARFETGLQGGVLYAKTYGSDGKIRYEMETEARGSYFSVGNENASYGAQGFTVRDNASGKYVTAGGNSPLYDNEPFIEVGWNQKSLTAAVTAEGLEIKRDNYGGVRGTIRNLDQRMIMEAKKWSENGLIVHNDYSSFKYGGKELMEIKASPWGETDIVLQYVTLRNGSGMNGYLQVMNGPASSHWGVMASEFKIASKKAYKMGGKPLSFDPLEKIMQLEPKEYFLKADMEKLYEMRESRKDGESVPTLGDIQKRIGFYADDVPIEFTDTERNGINSYPLQTITVAALQKYVKETDNRLNQIEMEINDENNSKRRSLRKNGGRTTKRSYSREKHLFCTSNRTRSGKPKIKSRK